jgi:DNA polymerase III delta prime subunit
VSDAVCVFRLSNAGAYEERLSHLLPLLSQSKLLILRGPPGVGKSALVTLLARDLGVEVVQWADSSASNPQPGRGEMELGGEDRPRRWGKDYVSQAQDFRNFLRAAAYCTLELAPVTGALAKDAAGIAVGAGEEKQENHARRLFLLEELPFHESDKTAEQFRAGLRYLLTEGWHPGVLVFTEVIPMMQDLDLNCIIRLYPRRAYDA